MTVLSTNSSRAAGSGRFPSTADTDADRHADEVAEEARAPKPTAPVADDDPSLLSESLAKIYIRQHKFAKALEIILTGCLNYSESIYFIFKLFPQETD